MNALQEFLLRLYQEADRAASSGDVPASLEIQKKITLYENELRSRS